MAQQLGQVAVGTLVKLNENGSPVEFYAAKHDYESGLNGAGRTLLVRKDVYEQLWWNNPDVNTYASSEVDNRLNSTYKSVLDGEVQELIGTTKIQYTPGNGNWAVGTLERAVFLLSLTELGKSRTTANVEGSALPIASTLIRVSFGGGPFTQWTRTPNTSSGTSVWVLQITGDEGTFNTISTAGVRPAFTLPGTLFVQSDGSISKTIPAPKTITVPVQSMQGNQIPVSWSAVDGADGYILERKANTDADWVQVYSGAELTFNETAGGWETVQYRVKSGAYNIYGDYTISAVVPVAGSSVLVISGSDGNLGTLTNDVRYSVSSSGTSALTVTESAGRTTRTFTATNGATIRIPVMDLPTGSGTIKITASTNPGSGVVTVTRNWTYSKTAPTFANAGSTAQLQQNGKNIFPLTLLECVRGTESLAPGGFGWGDSKALTFSTDEEFKTYFETNILEKSYRNIVTASIYIADVYGYRMQMFATSNEGKLTGGVRFFCMAMDGTTFSRCIDESGNWQPWEYVNPPMQLGVEYRTVERYISKPVYVKAINFGALPNNANKSVEHGVEDMGICFELFGNSSPNSAPSIGVNLIGDSRVTEIYRAGNVIYIGSHVAFQTSSAIVVMKYTKTTD